MKEIILDKLSKLIEEHAKEELDSEKICGKEIIIHQDYKCVYHKMFGKESIGGNLLSENNIYRIASMTKPVTATAVLQLVENGRLNLDDSIEKFYPDIKNAIVGIFDNNNFISFKPIENTVTVESLLNHTSGIGAPPIRHIQNDISNNLSLQKAAEYYIRVPLSFEPGTQQGYSSTASFDIAASIVERITGMNFEEYVKEHIFTPLGMADTTFIPTDKQIARMVKMFNRTEDGKGINVPHPEGCVFANYKAERMPAGAGLISTANDYIKFADMLCRGGVSADGVRILKEESVKNMATPHVSEKIMPLYWRWGLGVRVITSEKYNFGLPVGCFGWSGAYGSHFWVDPKNKITAVCMKNGIYDGGGGNNTANQLELDVTNSLN